MENLGLLNEQELEQFKKIEFTSEDVNEVASAWAAAIPAAAAAGKG